MVEVNTWKHRFIHSGHSYSAPSGPLLLRGVPDYSTDTVSEFHAEAHTQLQVKDLPKVPTWRLERESNPRPSSLKSSSQPRRHHTPLNFYLDFLPIHLTSEQVVQPSLTSMYLTMPSGMDVLQSLFKYSMMSFVMSPTETAAYSE